eukprot:Platyproteum_vivax@DN6369_c0_g1_i2.p1
MMRNFLLYLSALVVACYANRVTMRMRALPGNQPLPETADLLFVPNTFKNSAANPISLRIINMDENKQQLFQDAYTDKVESYLKNALNHSKEKLFRHLYSNTKFGEAYSEQIQCL